MANRPQYEQNIDNLSGPSDLGLAIQRGVNSLAMPGRPSQPAPAAPTDKPFGMRPPAGYSKTPAPPAPSSPPLSYQMRQGYNNAVEAVSRNIVEPLLSKPPATRATIGTGAAAIQGAAAAAPTPVQPSPAQSIQQQGEAARNVIASNQAAQATAHQATFKQAPAPTAAIQQASAPLATYDPNQDHTGSDSPYAHQSDLTSKVQNRLYQAVRSGTMPDGSPLTPEALEEMEGIKTKAGFSLAETARINQGIRDRAKGGVVSYSQGPGGTIQKTVNGISAPMKQEQVVSGMDAGANKIYDNVSKQRAEATAQARSDLNQKRLSELYDTALNPNNDPQLRQGAGQLFDRITSGQQAADLAKANAAAESNKSMVQYEQQSALEDKKIAAEDRRARIPKYQMFQGKPKFDPETGQEITPDPVIYDERSGAVLGKPRQQVTQAPQGALAKLQANPDLLPSFIEKYGYNPNQQKAQ